MSSSHITYLYLYECGNCGLKNQTKLHSWENWTEAINCKRCQIVLKPKDIVSFMEIFIEFLNKKM